MPKGKELYIACREFIDELDLNEKDEIKSEEDIETIAKLGMHLLVDLVESMHRLSVKIG